MTDERAASPLMNRIASDVRSGAATTTLMGTSVVVCGGSVATLKMVSSIFCVSEEFFDRDERQPATITLLGPDRVPQSWANRAQEEASPGSSAVSVGEPADAREVPQVHSLHLEDSRQVSEARPRNGRKAH